MARQGINTGSSPNDGLGDSLLGGAIKINSNFSEIYSTFGDGTNLVNYAPLAGVSTSVIGGISSVNSLRVSGISTLGIVTSGNIYSTGIITATSFVGDGSNLTNLVVSEGNTYYVTVDGSNSNSGTSLASPFLTLKYALSVATSGDTIRVGVGTFTEIFPLTVPQGVAIRGIGLRSTLIEPTSGTRTNDCFLLNGETTVEDMTVANIYEPGYAFRFAPNMKTTIRSPYIQRVTVLNRGSVTSSIDPYGFDTPHNPPATYKAGRGVLIDGSSTQALTLEPAMLFNECTFICPNNIALEMTNGARTEWVNCFTYFADKGIYAYDGNVGLGSTGYVRIKTTGFTGTTPEENDQLYYLETNSQSGTYAQVGTALTITKVGHGLTVGDRIFADFTSGLGTDGFYRVIEYVGLNTFAVSSSLSQTTSGNVIYKETLGFGTIRSYTSASGLSSITGKGEGLFELPSSRISKTTTPYGNTSLSTTQAKFGTASLSVDGVDDYAVIQDSSDFNFGTGDFTVEFWVRPNSIGSQQVVLDSRTSSGDTAIYLEINASGNVRFFTANAYRITSSVAVTADNWSHIALSRSSGTTRLFVNGTLTPTTYADTNNYANRSFRIGGNFSGSVFYGGYIDELRISNIARYTGTFTVASAQFNSDGFDKILLHFDGINGSTLFIDSSIPSQDIRWVRSGVGIATATKITLADYQQFGAEMRSIGSAVVFGNTGITADGPGVGLRLFAFNFGHIGSGKDFSQDVSLVVQSNEVISTNNSNVYFVSIDQSGDFRVGDAFYVNQESGTVNFGGQNFTINSLSDLNITDGTNTTTITPTTLNVGNVQISANEITTTSGDLVINPSGINSITIQGDVNVSGAVYSSNSFTDGDKGDIIVSANGALWVVDTLPGLTVTGVSTFTNGPVLIGSGTSTGTALQRLQITGGGYISGNVGIGTTNPQTARLDVHGSVAFGTGTDYDPTFSSVILRQRPANDGYASLSFYPSNGNLVAKLDAVSASNEFQVWSDKNSSTGPRLNINMGTNEYISFSPRSVEAVRILQGGTVLVGSITSTGTISQPLQVTGGGYFSGSVGIGTTNPTSKLSVEGSAIISGIVTSGIHNVTIGNDYRINNTSVLNATTLGTGVINSSLTSVGTLGLLLVGVGGINVTGITTSNSFNAPTGNDYRINNTSVLNATTLGTGVINSSLTSVGTLTALQVDNININGNVISSTDVNGNINLDPTGSGVVRILGDTELRFLDVNNINYVSIGRPATITADYTITLPNSVSDANDVMQFDVSGNASFVSNTRTLNFVIDGGDAPITAGSKGYAVVDFDCTITGWTIVADVSGNIAVTVNRASYTNFPTFTNIDGSEPPILSAAQKNEDLTLTTWTTSLSARDVLEFVVDSNAADIIRATVAIRLVPR